MNGKPKTSIKIIIDGLLDKAKNFFLKEQRKLLIFLLVIFLYFFVIIMYHVASKAPVKPQAKQQISQLYLMEFINGWRDYQQNFDIEDLRFGEKFLAFTINLKLKTKSMLIVKKLAMEMILGLEQEYPELEDINIKVICFRDLENIVYGTAVYNRDIDEVTWAYK
ncbi:MAG: hypothetical protein KKD05_07860 [Candidatus Omnitrophica bacterium]|nr:hypothetical protein [Candidatus Omnitrophota bacterium]